MASEPQIEANRTNALKSTGPRREVGRATSSRNALAYGLTSHQALLPGEDVQRFAELKAAIFENLKPDGVVEIDLFERVAMGSSSRHLSPQRKAHLKFEVRAVIGVRNTN